MDRGIATQDRLSSHRQTIKTYKSRRVVISCCFCISKSYKRANHSSSEAHHQVRLSDAVRSGGVRRRVSGVCVCGGMRSGGVECVCVCVVRSWGIECESVCVCVCMCVVRRYR